MSTYAIGDIQGCYREFVDLLEAIGFDRHRDRLWLVGDLVNRGPDSVQVLRAVRDLGEACVSVLGNHDLHLLAVASGAVAPGERDTFSDVLEAPDRDELLGWLQRLPVIHRDPQRGFLMVHAGVHPAWSADQAQARATELEAVLRGPHSHSFFGEMYGDQPDRWSTSLQGWPRLRVITNTLTRMRYVGRDGAIDLQSSGRPGEQPSGLMPWFAAHGRRKTDETIVFGHWAALKLDARAASAANVCHLDTGCVWGGELTAMRLEDGKTFSVPSQQPRAR